MKRFEILWVTPWLFKIMDPFFKAIAIAAWPFIFLKTPDLKSEPALLNHERIHHRQELEMLLVFQMLAYTLFNIYWFLRTWSINEAYLHNPFEQEAFWNESNLGYLDERKFWAWTKYIRYNPRVRRWKEQNPGQKL